jgi:hypothetical protein
MVCLVALAMLALTPAIAYAEVKCTYFKVVHSITIFGVHIGDFTYEEGWVCTQT